MGSQISETNASCGTKNSTLALRKRVIGLLIMIALCLSSVLPLTAMDLARVETRTDLAVSTYGVSGQGVIVALLDRGIDWKNNDFQNDDEFRRG